MPNIDSLLAAMTLEEKIGQMTMVSSAYAVTGPTLATDSPDAIKAGLIGNLLNMVGADHVHEVQRLAVEQSRLGIPLMIGFDIIHGHRTIFPVPLAQAAIFDPAVWERLARESAIEACEDGLHMTFNPMLDVARDPRWGRIVEGPGEDPWVAARMAEATIRGYQGSDLASATSIAATAKHFCAYAPVTAGREYAAVDMSERALREVYLPPFEAALEAGVAAFMPAFTDLAGVPLTAHIPLLQGWLRREHGFDGVIVSDYNAIAELIRHGVAADMVEAAALAVRAGVDIDMMAGAYRAGLPGALERGLVTIDQVDACVRRVLTLKQRLGLFDDPYGRGSRQSDVEPRRAVAREAARRAAVLLTNRNDVLPLKAPARLALVGPLADARAEMRGAWWAAGNGDESITVLEGLRRALPGTAITHVAGVGIDGTDAGGLPPALDAARAADIVVLCVGEAATMSGEAASRARPVLPGRQQELADAVLGLGKPVVVVLFSGRPLMVPQLIERADATLAAWFLGCEAGNAIADLLTGAASPSGRLPVSWPRDAGQIPIFFAQRPTGRHPDPKDHYTSKYLDMPNTPQFPFGHGLGYGRFAVSNLRVGPAVVREGQTIAVSVDVANQGGARAEETIFLFSHDKVASVTRPLLELHGVSKVTLGPGERSEVRFSLPVASLAFLGQDMQPRLEAGEFEVLVGQSADRERLLAATIRLEAEHKTVEPAGRGQPQLSEPLRL